MEIRRVGVVGCGIMGSGIAQLCAQSGYDVTVSEVSEELLAKGMASINSFLAKSVEKGKISQQDKDSILARLRGTTRFQDFRNCDLVIEAASENMDLKKKIFSDLDKACPPNTILATNTSVLCVVEIAAATSRDEKVVGMHFFNPAPIMKLLEVAKTLATSEDTFETAMAFGKSLGKTVGIPEDTPGLIVSRLGTPWRRNARRMLEAGLASAEDIDAAVKLGLGHPMGPLELIDFGGLDTLYSGAQAMFAELSDPAYAPPPMLKRMVKAGRLGRKTGRGFYDYRK